MGNKYWIIEQKDIFPGEEFVDCLYISNNREEVTEVYNRLKDKLKNCEWFEDKEAGFLVENSFISIKEFKNSSADSIVKEMLDFYKD